MELHAERRPARDPRGVASRRVAENQTVVPEKPRRHFFRPRRRVFRRVFFGGSRVSGEEERPRSARSAQSRGDDPPEREIQRALREAAEDRRGGARRAERRVAPGGEPPKARAEHLRARENLAQVSPSPSRRAGHSLLRSKSRLVRSLHLGGSSGASRHAWRLRRPGTQRTSRRAARAPRVADEPRDASGESTFGRGVSAARNVLAAAREAADAPRRGLGPREGRRRRVRIGVGVGVGRGVFIFFFGDEAAGRAPARRPGSRTRARGRAESLRRSSSGGRRRASAPRGTRGRPRGGLLRGVRDGSVDGSVAAIQSSTSSAGAAAAAERTGLDRALFGAASGAATRRARRRSGPPRARGGVAGGTTSPRTRWGPRGMAPGWDPADASTTARRMSSREASDVLGTAPATTASAPALVSRHHPTRTSRGGAASSSERYPEPASRRGSRGSGQKTRSAGSRAMRADRAEETRCSFLGAHEAGGSAARPREFNARVRHLRQT